MTRPSTPPPPKPPARRFSPLDIAALVGMFVLALGGLAMLAFAVFSLNNGASNAPATDDGATQAPTSQSAIPTTTPAPPATATLEPTATVEQAAVEPTPEEAAATPGPALTVSQGINVRGGPGTTYAILGGFNAGDTAVPVGRDSAAQWFVIPFSLSADGIGWLSSAFVTYPGDINALPVVAAAAPPPAGATSVAQATTAPGAATTAPGATNTPPPTNTPAPLGSRGIVASEFRVENTTAGVNQEIWFNFQVRNTTDADIAYSVLAAHTDVGFTAQSWTNETLDAGQSLTWRDHIKISAPGTYQLYLGICYGGREACLAGQAPWDRLSNNVTVTVQ